MVDCSKCPICSISYELFGQNVFILLANSWKMEQLSNSSQKIGGAHPELFPFRVSYIVKRNETLFSEGQVLSNADRCGMFICERGEVEVSFEEQSYVIHRGDMYIYLASSLVRIRKIHPDTEGFLLDGNLDFLTVLANRVLNAEQILFIRYHPCLTLTEAQHKSLRHSIHAYEERLRDLYTTSSIDAGRRTVLRELYQSLGSSFFFEVIYIYLTNKPLDPKPLSNRDLVFQRFYNDLSRHYCEEREVTFYAALQHVSPRYFSSLVKEVSGRSASQWIAQKVIAEAKALLEMPDLSIKEIATRFNFPSQSFFGKYFKHYVGCSPKAYRRQSGY